MTSNSKLTSVQKEILRDFKAEMAKNMAFGQAGRVTVLAQITGNVVRFSTSVASPDEKKIRRKVGQYHAAARWDHDMHAVMPMPSSAFGQWTVQEVAQHVAELLNSGE